MTGKSPTDIPIQSGCPLCGSKAVIRKGTLQHSGASVLRCGHCSHTFAWPFPTSASPSSNDMATESLESFSLGLLNQSEGVKQRQRQLATNRTELYSSLLEAGRTPFRMLEVGCGSGGLGTGFAQLGNEYLGIDIDHRVVEEGQRNGLDVRRLDVMELSLEETFDVIFFTQVLEHILEPTVFLAKVRQHLRPGGILHLDVPNQATLAGWPSIAGMRRGERWGAIEYPHHCMSYSKHSLTHALAQVPGLASQVFTTTCDHDTWGQAVDPGFVSKAYYRASTVMRSESLLVGLGRAST